MRRLLLALALVLSSACASAPASLSPQSQIVWHADQGVVALGTVQHAAIELNKIQVCDPAPCHPLFSDANTRVVVSVVTDALTTIKPLPAGWKPVAVTALDRLVSRLDASGQQQLGAYVAAARTIVNSLAF